MISDSRIGGRRRGAGRPAHRLKCEQFLALDIRQLHARGRLRVGIEFAWEWLRDGESVGAIRITVAPSALVLMFRADRTDVTQCVTLTCTACRFGGARTWLVCPDCGRRCALLYGVNQRGRFSCRLCMRLAYSSQSDSATDRLERRQLRIEARLSPDGGKPKWMRGRTYARLLDELDTLAGARITLQATASDRYSTT